MNGKNEKQNADPTDKSLTGCVFNKQNVSFLIFIDRITNTFAEKCELV